MAGLDWAKFGFYQFPIFLFIVVIIISILVTLILGAIHSTKVPTGPTGKGGPPQNVDPFFRNFSGWTEPIHWVLDRNFRKFWLNGSRHKLQSIINHWRKFCSDRTWIKSFMAIGKYRYGLPKTVSKHLKRLLIVEVTLNSGSLVGRVE